MVAPTATAGAHTKANDAKKLDFIVVAAVLQECRNCKDNCNLVQPDEKQ